jgi:hypothetical protein
MNVVERSILSGYGVPSGCLMEEYECDAHWAPLVEGKSGDERLAVYNTWDGTVWTNTYCPKGAGGGISIREYVESLPIWNGIGTSGLLVGTALRALPSRDYFALGGSVSGGGGAPAALEVDVLASPYLLPDVEAESFKIEPVLRAGFMPALRPGDVGGVQLHPSRYATMRVMSIEGSVKYATTNFCLDTVQKDIRENFAVRQSFHGTQLEFNKERYRVYNFGLSLIDSRNLDWDRAFELAWQRFIRGAVLAARKWRWYMLEGGRLYGGYPLGYSHRKSAAGEPVTGLTLQVYITDDIPLPEMRMYPAPGFSANNGFYRWKGDSYVEGADVSMNAIKDYEPQIKPGDPTDVEYSDDEDGGFGTQGDFPSDSGSGMA